MNEELTPADILEENLPSGISTLIVGPPGSGKTILSQQLLYQILKRGGATIYIASESQISLITSQKQLFSWNILTYLEESQFTPMEIGDVADPTELNISLAQAIRESRQPLSLVVVDSLTLLMVGMEQRKIMKFTEALNRRLQNQQVGLLLLITPTKETEDFLTKMKSLVSLVIEIKLEERGTIRRHMRIFKYLGRKHSTQWFPFEITDNGIRFPAIPARPAPSTALFLPKLIPIEEVSTPYSPLKNLLRRIKKEKLSCIVETTFSSGQGIMLFSEGEQVTSVILGKDGKRVHAPQLLENSIKTKKGTLSVHSIRSDIVPLLMGYLEDQILFRNLSFDQMRFEEILESLSESEFSGCVLMRGDSEQGIIFIDEGEVIEAYFENEHVLHSRDALSAFEEAAARGNFHVDIFFSPRGKKLSEEKGKPSQVVTSPRGVLPEFIPLKGLTVQGAFINATLRHLQKENSSEWSSTLYYPRPLQDIAISKVEDEILRLKAMNDPYLKRDTYKLRRGYKNREWYPVDEYLDIVYAVTRMLEFSWPYENQDQYELGWGKLSKAYFELGKTVSYSMDLLNQEKLERTLWYNYFVKVLKKWKDMGSFSELKSKKEGKKVVLNFSKDVEPPPRRKGMLWGLLEKLGLSKFDIQIDGEDYIVTFG